VSNGAERDNRGARLREEHQPAAVPHIGDDPAEHRERDDGHDANEADQAECQRLPFRRHEQRHVPQQRGVLHHRPGQGHEQAKPEQTEVAVRQGRSDRARARDG
jgi:hypothetical protein